ncbi:MAG: ATP-binding protein, partial [Kiritimatiellae bacterium]|nr:ATP-binding protein [Kiritimatiellia bacterium]
MRFYGRDSLIRQLQDLWGKRVSSFVTCRGRRRIGKSTLIARFAVLSEARFIRIEGVKPNETTTDEDERAYFATQLAEQTGAES